MRRLPACLLVAAALAGCGGGEEEDAAAPPPTATATATAAPTATGTPSPTPTPTPTPTPSAAETPSPEDQPGGAGDEEEIRVPVEFRVTDGGITPPQVSVPAFLALELIVRNRSSAEVTAELEGAEPLVVPAGGTARARLEGRRPGSYVLDAGPAGQALLVTGAEPGP